MRNCHKFFLLLIVFCLVRPVLHAAPGNPYFIQHFDNRNGLSNSSINYLYSDGSNLLWVATWDGLNLYDGTTFHVFNYSRENDFKTIGSNVIQQILEDGKGNIWVSTIEGVSKYVKTTGRFSNYFYDPHRGSKLSEQEFTIAADREGNVYCLSEKNGLSYYDDQADAFVSCRVPGDKRRFTKFSFDGLNRMWMLDAEGLVQVFEKKNKQFSVFSTIDVRRQYSNFFQFDEKIFLTSRNNELFVVEESDLMPRPVAQLKHSLSSMMRYKENYIMAWSTKGFDVYDQQLHPSKLFEDEVKQLKDIKITSVSLGSEDILWMGTDGNGLIKIFPKTKSFTTVTTSDNGLPYNKSVRAFCEVNGSLWVGTKGGGILELKNYWDKTAVPVRNYYKAGAEIENNSVYALLKGRDDRVYIGSDARGLTIYDIKRKRFYKWNDVTGADRFAEFGSVYAIKQDLDSSLWLGTSGFGLIHLKLTAGDKGVPTLQYLQRFVFNPNGNGPANDIIYALEEGTANTLWIGCRYGGLSLLNKNTLKFTSFKAFTYEGSLSNNDVLSLYKDGYNKLWIGTSYGLNWIQLQETQKKEPVFQKMTTLNGLPNNTIHAIEEDSNGNIWVSTNKGLAIVSRGDLQISYYQQTDGLQSNEFCDGAVWKDERTSGLFFGGTYGFNSFLPQEISKSAWQPNLLVSAMLMGGKDNSDKGLIVVTPKRFTPAVFTINRKDNFFELDLKAISFLNAEKCEYAYYLEGYDKNWHYAGGNGKVIYSNILPGEYRLKIKWSNGEGLWTGETVLFALEVKNYFWLTSWAFLVYGLLLAIAGFVFYKYRRNKLEMKHQLEVEHLMRTKEEEIYQNRLGFFTNIAHELQTPLTLIMGSAEQFVDKNHTTKEFKVKPYFFSIIHQQASRLTYLVQQLLEFRKVEEGFYKNRFSFLHLSELFLNLAEPFRLLSEKNKMEYEVHIAAGMYGWVDKDKVEKIVFNLLSNAFKHSVKNDQVFFSVTDNKTSNEIEIRVMNSGTIPQERLEKIFDQFYGSAGDSNGTDLFGTGIGLAFTKQLVSLLDGKIMVSNEEGRINFAVHLPLLLQEPGSDKGIITASSSDKPSYLYNTITGYTESFHQEEPNKQAIIETLQETEKKSVLVVEDDADIRFLLRDILNEEYIVYEAADAKKALSLMDKSLPDLVICDVMMPEMSGLEFCNKLKNTQATCQIPVIILSARGSEDHHIEGYEVGADAYIAKPFHTAHLKLRVRKLLEYRQKMLQLFEAESVSEVLVGSELAETDRNFLKKLVKEIEDRLSDGELTAVVLEKTFNLSKMQLYRKLKTMTGMTPGEFIRHTRLKEAAKLLKTTNLTVTEIFFRTGFNNQSYFFREFRKQFNCAPNEYREQKLKSITD